MLTIGRNYCTHFFNDEQLSTVQVSDLVLDGKYSFQHSGVMTLKETRATAMTQRTRRRISLLRH